MNEINILDQQEINLENTDFLDCKGNGYTAIEGKVI